MADGPTMQPTRKVRKPAHNWTSHTNNLLNCLTANNWTVKRLAKEIEMSEAIINDWIKYKRCPLYASLAFKQLTPRPTEGYQKTVIISGMTDRVNKLTSFAAICGLKVTELPT